jgi:hypothetical protein
MVFNATFTNISAILWRAALLVEETGVPGENHRPATSHWQSQTKNNLLFFPCNDQWTSYAYIWIHWIPYLGTIWIGNFLCNYCLLPLTLRVRIPLRRGVLDATLCDNLCQWLVAGRWFSPGTPVSSNYIIELRYEIISLISFCFKAFVEKIPV